MRQGARRCRFSQLGHGNIEQPHALLVVSLLFAFLDSLCGTLRHGGGLDNFQVVRENPRKLEGRLFYEALQEFDIVELLFPHATKFLVLL
jgi:hypothetical protein